MATAAEHAQLARQSMKTPPLFETPPSSTQYHLDAPAPSRNSMLFTQPVANPEYGSSGIAYERKKKPTSNRNSALLSGPELQEKKRANRATVFIDNPATRKLHDHGYDAAAAPVTYRRSSSGRQVAQRGGRRNPRPMSLDAATMRQKTRNRHTVMNPTGIGLTIIPQTPLPEEDEDDAEVSSNSTLKDSPPMDPSSLSPGLPGARPPMKSQISDLYGLHDDEFLPPTPAVAERPPLTTSESTLVAQPLVPRENAQLRPNAGEIRTRRHSRASRALSKAASTPLSNSYGVGAASLAYGTGSNAGLKDLSFGQYGMNQNFGIVSHRASVYLAQEDERERGEKEKEKVRRRSAAAAAARNGGRASPVRRKPVARTPVGRSKRWVDVLFGWAKGLKSHGDSREELKERIQHTTI